MAMVFFAGPLSGLIVQPLVMSIFSGSVFQTLVSLTVEYQDFLLTTQNLASEDGDRT